MKQILRVINLIVFILKKQEIKSRFNTNAVAQRIFGFKVGGVIRAKNVTAEFLRVIKRFSKILIYY